MRKIAVNKFHTLEFRARKINEIAESDRYFDVFLLKKKTKDEELVAEIKINLKSDLKSSLTIKKKGDLIHPKVLLAVDKFMKNYYE